MNKIFVIEGTDGSGKQTQANLIYKRLLESGRDILKTSFPNYENPSSGPVKEYLSGNITKNPNEVSSKAASCFYAVDRYISYKQDIEKYYNDDKTIILFDRYISSNLLHQGGKLLNENNDFSKLDEFSNWVLNLECNDLELPLPTQVFFFFFFVEYSMELMKNRNNKFSHTEKKDILETDKDHLQKAEASGLYYAKKFGWKIIECIKDGKLRSIEDINDEIYSDILNMI